MDYVYILWRDLEAGPDFFGIFSSVEKARDEILTCKTAGMEESFYIEKSKVDNMT